MYIYLSIYIPWPFPPVWGVADNTKETTKTMGVSLRSSSNDEGSSRVWMALLEQHSPSFPVFHNLRRFIDAVSPTAPTTGLPLQVNPVATADANQNCITIIRHSFLFLARSLASLISILLSYIHTYIHTYLHTYIIVSARQSASWPSIEGIIVYLTCVNINYPLL